MILILGGTTEARLLLEKLVDKQEPVIICTAYDFAKNFIKNHPLVEHIIGRLNAEDLRALIAEKGVDVIIDTTHPYALEGSRNAKLACERNGINYIRLERESLDATKYERAHYVDSYEMAASLACEIGKTVFLSTGSNHADIFRREADSKGCKLYIRVIPDENSIMKCLEAGFSNDEITAGVGPFSFEDNRQLWQKLGIDVVVTKDSGQQGGFNEKVNAAKDLGLAVVIIKRPIPEKEALRNIDEVMDALEKSLKPRSGVR